MLYFLFLLDVILVVASFYLYRRLIPKTWARSLRLCLLLFFIFLSFCLPAQFIFRDQLLASKDHQWMTVISYCIGFYLILLTFTLIRDIFWLGYKIISPKTEGSQERRHFLRQTSSLGILAATGSVMGYGAYRARGNPTVSHINIPIANLPPELEGFSIVQLSDIHVGQLQNEAEYLKKIVAATNALNADIVAVTGDVVDGSVALLKERVAPLSTLKSKLNKTYFVTGNHEYYSGAIEWIEHFKTFDWHVLGNTHEVLNIGGHSLVIAGVHDFRAGNVIPSHACNPSKALANAPENASATVLLAHNPSTYKLTEGLPIHLQLSGHTHGGQFFPGTWLLYLAHKFVKGLSKYDNHLIYVNSGTGYWGPPLRTTDIVGEITLLKLVRA